MSITDVNTTDDRLGSDRPPAARLRIFARGLLGRLDFAADRTRLRDMPDHILRDIGFIRDGIDEALRGAGRHRRGSR